MALRLSFFFCLFATLPCAAQQEILALYDLSVSGSSVTLRGRILIDSAATINDPAFHPTDSILYYTRKAGSRCEVVELNFRTMRRIVIANSPLELTHPSAMPAAKSVSAISADDGKLVKITSAGTLTTIYGDTPLVNYLWIDENALLAITPGDPNQLSLITLRPRKTVPIAQHVGNELRRAGNVIAFVHKLSVDTWSVKTIKPDGSIDILTETLPDSDQFALLPGGRMIMISDGQLLFRASNQQWVPIALPEPSRFQIKSLAASNAGDKLFVLFATP